MDWGKLDTRRFFLLGMRLAFGLWLFYVGVITKWFLIGPVHFIGFITGQFDKTWSPHLLNVVLAWVIVCSEPILSVLILSGWKPRLVWSAAALFMFMLTLGQTISNGSAQFQNWAFLVLLLTCAAMSDPLPGTRAQ